MYKSGAKFLLLTSSGGVYLYSTQKRQDAVCGGAGVWPGHAGKKERRKGVRCGRGPETGQGDL